MDTESKKSSGVEKTSDTGRLFAFNERDNVGNHRWSLKGCGSLLLKDDEKGGGKVVEPPEGRKIVIIPLIQP